MPSCEHHGCASGAGERLVTWPSVLTAVRTVVALVCALYALVQPDRTGALVAAVVAYWVGDAADGMLARAIGQETRIGGVFDVLCDRLCAALVFAAFLVRAPDMALPVGIFLAQFMVVDCFLTLAFLRWPLLSPNYFWLVDRWIYRWNWSPVAKGTNTGALLIVMVVTGSVVLSTALALGVLAVKVISVRRLARLADRIPEGCAARPPAPVAAPDPSPTDTETLECTTHPLSA